MAVVVIVVGVGLESCWNYAWRVGVVGVGVVGTVVVFVALVVFLAVLVVLASCSIESHQSLLLLLYRMSILLFLFV